MCLLCYFPPNVEVNENHLENACLSNPDGFGFSFLKPNGELNLFHTMNPDQAISEFMSERAENPDSHALFHARIATAGSVNVENCHPFAITGVNALLGHNGHLPVDIPKYETRSDTKIFAQDILPKWLKSLDNPKRFKMLEKWASGNKLVIFSNDEKLAKKVYLINEKLGVWENGAWFSNHSYKWSPPNYFYGVGSVVGSESGLDYFGDSWFCPECFGSNLAETYCLDCFFCFDCDSDAGECLCYGTHATNNYELGGYEWGAYGSW